MTILHLHGVTSIQGDGRLGGFSLHMISTKVIVSVIIFNLSFCILFKDWTERLHWLYSLPLSLLRLTSSIDIKKMEVALLPCLPILLTIGVCKRSWRAILLYCYMYIALCSLPARLLMYLHPPKETLCGKVVALKAQAIASFRSNQLLFFYTWQ